MTLVEESGLPNVDRRRLIYGHFVNSAVWLAGKYESRNEWMAASGIYQEIVDIQKQELGANHWRVRYAMSTAEHAKELSSWPSEKLGGWNATVVSEAIMLRLMEIEKYGDAIQIGVGIVASRKRLTNRDNIPLANLLLRLAEASLYCGNHAQAKRFGSEASDVVRRLLGENSPDYARCLAVRSVATSGLGDLETGIHLRIRANAVITQTLGELDGEHFSGLNNLAVLYQRAGKLDAAKECLRDLQSKLARSVGVDHPLYFGAIGNLAVVLESMGDYQAAAATQESVLNSLSVQKDKRPLSYATAANNLGAIYLKLGQFAPSRALLEESLAIRKQMLGETSSGYLECEINLAELSRATGNFADSVKRETHCLDLFAQALSKHDPLYATLLNNAGVSYLGLADTANADRLLSDAVSHRRRILHDMHPDLAISLTNLASVKFQQRRFEDADGLYREGLLIARNSLESSAIAQSERQQFAMANELRHQLDGYISLGLEAPELAERVFREVMHWKGATLVRQRGMRQAADDPDVAEQFAKLQDTARQLAALSRLAPSTSVERDAWQRRRTELTGVKEAQEAELSRRSAAYRASIKQTALDELLDALPENGALVDFLEFTRSTPPHANREKAQFERQFVAFVVRKTESDSDRVKLLGLGSAEPIVNAIDTWRQTFGNSAAGSDAGSYLRKTLWEPLLPSLAEADTILISTDGALGRFAFVALPGSRPGSYLLEERRLAMLPMPQLLPSLVGKRTDRDARKELLLLGDVDYDSTGAREASPPKKKTPRRPGEAKRAPGDDVLFSALEYTKPEIDALRDLYVQLFDVAVDDPLPLTRSLATEAEFCRLAPNYRHLHLATHGFFAAPEYVPAIRTDVHDAGRGLSAGLGRDMALAGYNPGLLSGLALAGANLEPHSNGDDGILTAQEIAFLPLQGVDMVVLSACETGLGDVAGGEGLLGVQRAFQVAGVGTTIAGLWKVDDLQTMALMKRFYHNLWKEEMSRLDALREAQLWMLKEGPRRDARITTTGAEPVEARRSPPYYWAPFVLSGDWR